MPNERRTTETMPSGIRTAKILTGEIEGPKRTVGTFKVVPRKARSKK